MAKPLMLQMQGGEVFKVNGLGHIGRPRIGMACSPQWLVLELIRYDNSGRVAERHGFSQWPLVCFEPGWSWAHKNGKLKWHIHDLDHGTHRFQGEAVRNMWEAES